MQVQVTVTTEVTDSVGKLLTSVTTVEKTAFGDNPRFVRSEMTGSDVYGKAVSLNLDQVEARFSRVW